jgi:hypothetical protein
VGNEAGLQRRGPLHEGYFLSLRVDLAALASSQNKATPLHLAAFNGHADVSKVLLAAGANVHATDDVSVWRGVGWITEIWSHVPSPKTRTPLAHLRAELLLLLSGKRCSMCLYT